ncbi:MAG: diaminopimelate epimerase [Planctomycetota bacterium]|nr:diaminopimelate epimerase [Planctomycetota bacterium]
MTPIPFEKVHGLGNDFVLIDALADAALSAVDWAALAPAACDRHTGIGADGVLVLLPPDRPGSHARMRIVNADGGDGGMCGNGIRCAARHLVEAHAAALRPAGVAHPLRLTIDVGDRTYAIDVETRDGRFLGATVDMGAPALPAGGPEPIPLHLLGRADVAASGWADACDLREGFVRVDMPNPHAVFFVGDVTRVALERVGPVIEHHPMFPLRTNVQFVQVLSTEHLRVRTWERGAGATLACGTGACAAVVAGSISGRCTRQATVSLPGGDLRVSWDGASGHVFMTGPAERVFAGQWRGPR